MNHSGECMIWEQQPAGDDGWHDCTCHVFYSNESSAHDPICPQATIYSGEWEPDQRHWSCHCDIIAKVRADERKQAEARVETLRNHPGLITICCRCPCSGDTWTSQL